MNEFQVVISGDPAGKLYGNPNPAIVTTIDIDHCLVSIAKLNEIAGYVLEQDQPEPTAHLMATLIKQIRIGVLPELIKKGLAQDGHDD